VAMLALVSAKRFALILGALSALVSYLVAQGVGAGVLIPVGAVLSAVVGQLAHAATPPGAS
jgi:hypothetical protein